MHTAAPTSRVALAFAGPAVRAGGARVAAGSFAATPVRPTGPRVGLRAARSRRVRMAATPPAGDDDDEAEKKAAAAMDDKDDEGGVSVWGVTSFAIIFAIFLVGIAATIARDFVPGGMTGPAPM